MSEFSYDSDDANLNRRANNTASDTVSNASGFASTNNSLSSNTSASVDNIYSEKYASPNKNNIEYSKSKYEYLPKNLVSASFTTKKLSSPKKSASPTTKKLSSPKKSASSTTKNLSTSLTKTLKHITQKHSSRKIIRFMKNTENSRRARFLNTLCSDSGVCLAFGVEANKIKKHFENFENFQLLSKPIRRVGSVSGNGFVNELTFEKNGYVSNAILKSSTRTRSDNLLYEYVVGTFVNTLGVIYPCFVETYGIYQYNPSIYSEMRSRVNLPQAIIKNNTNALVRKELTNSFLSTICTQNALFFSVLIQNLTPSKTLREVLLDDPSFVEEDLMLLLAQIYLPLSTIGNDFTHYDLHLDNVLLYEPAKGKCIEFYYNIAGGKELLFKCKYVAKIIDYGRCYFRGKTDPTARDDTVEYAMQSSEHMNERLRSVCSDFDSYGLKHFQSPTEYNHYVSSIKPNISHDLRLLMHINLYRINSPMLYITRRVDDPKVLKLSDRLNNNQKISKFLDMIKYKEFFGTPELKGITPNKLNNIHQVAEHILHLLNTSEFREKSDIVYRSSPVLGELTINLDSKEPAEFVHRFR
jgi:hypothetical protein